MEEKKNEPTASGEAAAAVPKKKNGVGKALLTVGGIFLAAVLLTGLIGLWVASQYYFYHQNQYRITMEAAASLEKAGLYAEAEELTEEELEHNYLYEPYRKEIHETAAKLWKEERFAELYRILLDTPYGSLLQKTCAKAADLALSRDDYETAYIYATSAPEPFVGAVVEAAQTAAYDPETKTLNQNACHVLMKAGEPERIDEIVRTVLRQELDAGNFLSARNLSEMLSDAAEGRSFRAEIVRAKAEKAMNAKNYPEVLRILREEGEELADRTYTDATRRKIYEAYLSARSLSEAAAMAAEFGYDFTAVRIEAEDADLRNALKEAYFLLSSAQKRAYHAHPLSASTLTYAAPGGKLTYQKHGRDTVIEQVSSVAASDYFALILHTDGTTEMLTELPYHHPETTAVSTALLPASYVSGKVVDIAVGERHAVCLMADGTVRATGDNSYGQCDTAGWADVVAVAAGKRFTVGLKADGTVTACGSNACGQCEVEDYRNVVDVRACWQSTVLLFRDGTAAIVGERGQGLDEVNGWTNVRRIRAGGCTVAAETKDGAYLTCGTSAADLSGLKAAADFDAGPLGCAAILSTGEVKTFH